MGSQMNAMTELFLPHAAAGQALSSIDTEAAQHFQCRLDDQPDHLVPEHQFQRLALFSPTDHPLVLNPLCWRTRDSRLPSEIESKAWLVENFELQNEMIWIQDPQTSALRPFWIGPELSAVLDDVSLTDLSPSDLSDRVLNLLAMIGVFVPQDSSARDRDWIEITQRCSTQFRQNGYAPIAGLIHPFHISALRRYYRRLTRTGMLELGDDQSSLRYVAHNEPIARFFHHELTTAISMLVGMALKPSYVYFSSYVGGANLEKHTDREQCQFSVTFCLDYSPEPARETSWPIQLHTPSGKTTVYQAIGDGLLYRGCEVPHSRDRLPVGHSSTSIFFHYVPVDFVGPLN
jgi:hypothetical protein